MSSIAARQIEIASEIKKILKNAKIYVERKTNIKYLEIRLNNLDKLYSEFQDNEADFENDYQYFTSKLSEEVTSLYEATKKFCFRQKGIIKCVEINSF